MKARRLLITGAGGFVGSWIARAAIREKFEVHGTVRKRRAPGRLSAVGTAVTLHEVDLENAPGVTEVLTRLRPALVVHAAFPAGHAVDESSRRELFSNGVGGAVNLLEAIRAAGSVENFVHVGSAMAYGPSSHPHDPGDALNPGTFRGTCKAAVSLLCRQFATEGRTNCSEVRVFTAYGPWEQPERLVPQLMRAALAGTTVQLSAQARLRNWIYVEDVAAACLAALNYSGNGMQVFNACNDEVTATHELARLVENLTGRTLVSGFDYPHVEGYGDANPRGTLPGPSDGTDWRPRHTLPDGLQQTWTWAQTPEGRRHFGVD